jgi:hypothetical protein
MNAEPKHWIYISPFYTVYVNVIASNLLLYAKLAFYDACVSLVSLFFASISADFHTSWIRI